MHLNSRKNVLLNLIHGFRLTSSQSLHTSRCIFEKTYYDLLNVRNDCNAKEIREAFICLAKKYHPDTNQGDAGSHARFVEIQQAYSVLSAPSKRHQYDLSLHANRTPSSSHSRPYRTYDGSGNEDGYHFNDEFKDFFYHSRQRSTNPNPRFRVGAVKLTLFLMAFTTVGALLQYYVLKWLYKRSYNKEMEKHERGMASFQALKQEMDKRSEEYDIRKLRAAYFKEFGSRGTVGMHLVPSIIRPTIPTGSLKSKDKMPSSSEVGGPDSVST